MCLLGRFPWAIVLLELPIALGLIGGVLGWFGALSCSFSFLVDSAVGVFIFRLVFCMHELHICATFSCIILCESCLRQALTLRRFDREHAAPLPAATACLAGGRDAAARVADQCVPQPH